MAAPLEIVGLDGLPEFAVGDDLGGAITAAGGELRDGDVVVVSQKVVSKVEGRTVNLGDIEPGARAIELGGKLDKDPRLVQLILDQSRRVVRSGHGVVIVETLGGWICANAGIDASNVPGEEVVALLPEDADASARRIRREIADACGVRPAVIVADSFGRPWRVGQVDVAIGCAGLAPIDDWRGRRDRDGMELVATAPAIADQAAAAADLARDKASGTPAVLIRGLERFVTVDDGPGAAVLRRAESDDLFR
jgi:coenzyme F420-0:L-glutamate ligase/coenzyme F420-1:gamma-L-glutamate ligase